MKTLCCTTCDRYVPTSSDGNTGDCRAHPPAALMCGVKNTVVGQKPLIESYWPTVGKGLFCGEHPEAPKRKALDGLPILRNMDVIDTQGRA